MYNGNREFYTKAELIEAVRQDIIGELDAINQYNDHIQRTENPLARSVWQSIKDEERVHVGELLALLNALDPSELKKLKAGQEEVEEIMRGLGM